MGEGGSESLSVKRFLQGATGSPALLQIRDPLSLTPDVLENVFQRSLEQSKYCRTGSKYKRDLEAWCILSVSLCLSLSLPVSLILPFSVSISVSYSVSPCSLSLVLSPPLLPLLYSSLLFPMPSFLSFSLPSFVSVSISLNLFMFLSVSLCLCLLSISILSFSHYFTHTHTHTL